MVGYLGADPATPVKLLQSILMPRGKTPQVNVREFLCINARVRKKECRAIDNGRWASPKLFTISPGRAARNLVRIAPMNAAIAGTRKLTQTKRAAHPEAKR